MLHEPASGVFETDNAAPKKANLGVIIFIVYTLIYSGFVLIGLTKARINGIRNYRRTKHCHCLWIWINRPGNSYGIYL